MALNTAAIIAKIAADLPDNTSQLITPASIRDALNALATNYENVADTPPAVLGNGAGASSSTFWRGDGVWATPGGGGGGGGSNYTTGIQGLGGVGAAGYCKAVYGP